MAVCPSFDLILDDDNPDECDRTAEAAIKPSAKITRFGDRGLKEVAQLIEQGVPASTKRSTASWIKMFNMALKAFVWIWKKILWRR